MRHQVSKTALVAVTTFGIAASVFALAIGDVGRPRCSWGTSSDDYAAYHDTEWGRPTIDERTLFEKICLEGFQSGLSWLTIRLKRQNVRAAFSDFDAATVGD